MRMIEPHSERLYMRQWREQDLEPFARMNADPEVMAYFPDLLSRTESDALAQRLAASIAQHGWGVWALECKDNGEFIVFTGLHRPEPELPCAPCIEIAWRLARPYWGQAYAYEAASQALKLAFNTLACAQIYSFTALGNVRSRNLMERLGMVDTNCNFAHPAIAAEHPVSEHVLYKLSQADWRHKHCEC